jgi:hypothetical protein
MSGDYKLEYLSIKNDYDIKCSTDSLGEADKLNEQITRLDAANNHRTTTTTTRKDNRPAYCFSNERIIGENWMNIQYYTESECKTRLKNNLNKDVKWNNDGPTLRGVKYGGCDTVDGSIGMSWQCRIDAKGSSYTTVTTPFDNTQEVKTAFEPIAQ